MKNIDRACKVRYWFPQSEEFLRSREIGVLVLIIVNP
jgi:hypothetical protein